MKEMTMIRPFFKRYNDIYLGENSAGWQNNLKFEPFTSQIQITDSMALLLVSL
jgi:hypothetical protein